MIENSIWKLNSKIYIIRKNKIFQIETKFVNLHSEIVSTNSKYIKKGADWF